MLPSLDGVPRSSDYNASGSFIDIKNHPTGANQTTSDILFLKRLLFLKASLDNDATTLNNFAVPFEEDSGAHLAYMNARAGLGTAPHGDRIKDGLSGTSPERLDGEDEKPLMITNGGMGDEPRRLGIPSGARSAPRTAGAKLRNQKNGGIVGSGGKVNGGVHGLPRPGKANGQRGEGAVLLGRIEQNKYVSERDNEKDIQRQM